MAASKQVAVLGLVLSSVLLFGQSGCGRTEDGPRSLNVLIVTLDTTRADYLGCYEPARKGLTPSFDELALDGVQFTRCFSQSSATPVSHASIFSGLYPFRHGLRVIYADSGYRLAEEVPYLPEVLGAAGWETAAILSSFTVSEFFGFERGYDWFDDGLDGDVDSRMERQSDGQYKWSAAANQRRSDQTTELALEWLLQRDSSRPFHLWLHFWDPHDWYSAEPTTSPPPDFARPHLEEAWSAGVGKRVARYGAEVAYVDQQFGRLVQALKDTGLYERTIIVVVADHGQGLDEHGWFGHRLLYQEQIHVPLIVRVPGWPTGQQVASPVRTIDILPTVLDALDLEVPRDVQGRSLRNLAHGVPEETRMAYADALNEFDLNSALVTKRPKDGNLYAATDGEWKLILRYDHPGDSELYNIAEDPEEARNLLDERPDQVQRLRSYLDELQPFRTQPFGHADQELDDEAVRRLRSLGYIDPGASPESGGAPPDEPAEAGRHP